MDECKQFFGKFSEDQNKRELQSDKFCLFVAGFK